MNISSSINEQTKIRMFNRLLYSSFTQLGYWLHFGMHYYEQGDTLQAFFSVEQAAGEITRIDAILRSHSVGVSSRHMYFSFIGRIPALHNLAVRLSHESHEMGGILSDGIISEQEIIFLTRLLDDVNIVIAKMSGEGVSYSDGVSFDLDENLSIRELSSIIYEFLSKWNRQHSGLTDWN